MKRFTVLLATFAAFALVASAQRGMPRYDVTTETTLKGTVEEVTAHKHGRMGGRHLMLKTEKETMEVHLGPAWYLDERKVTLAKGDEVEIIGSRVKMAGKDVVIARAVKKGNETWELRDAKGVPNWSRGRRRAT
ncbi:MAG: hypothetical protein U0Q16_35655 [Bryobacteraceae bacterium]